RANPTTNHYILQRNMWHRPLSHGADADRAESPAPWAGALQGRIPPAESLIPKGHTFADMDKVCGAFWHASFMLTVEKQAASGRCCPLGRNAIDPQPIPEGG